MNTIDQETQALRKMIKGVKNSGQRTWQIGRQLNLIKEKELFRPTYSSLKEYAEKALNLNNDQPNYYIKIFQNFTEDQITEHMIASHLFLLTSISAEKRLMMIEVMKRADSGQIGDTNLFEETDKKPIAYTKPTLETCLHIVAQREKLGALITIDNILDIFKMVRKEQESIKKKNRSHKRKFDIDAEHGNKIVCAPVFSNIVEKFPFEPLNEIGTVGLFFTIFEVMTKLNFSLDGCIYNFKSILYTRARFPDARIELQTSKGVATVDIEFEYKSFSYYHHAHYLENAKCQLIICWDDNWKQDFDLAHPPILSLKETLKQGKIVVL